MKHQIHFDGRQIELSNPDKVLWPKTGFTKGQMIDYYQRISTVMLPHLRGRPLTLKRYPDGVEGDFFFEKRCPPYRPSWISTCPLPSRRTAGKTINHCLAEDLPSLLWLANLAVIEFHPLLGRCRRIEEPTAITFDLDPGEPANIVDCCQVGLWIKEVLDDLGLTSFAKTSGSKGMQLYVPLNTPHTYGETKPFAHDIARLLQSMHPDRVVERMAKALRTGKVLIDWSQNDVTKTTVCAYSLRARELPMVSTPVRWDEVETAARQGNAALLQFQAPAVLDRVECFGDLFEAVLTMEQRLPRLR